METRPHPHLLEISAWPWLERLSREAGRNVTLGDVPAEIWDRYAAQGFDFIYLMGVWQRSALGRQIALDHPVLRAEYDAVLPGWKGGDIAGSPYCISDYVPDARMGGWSGLDAARTELHSRGLQLIVDFVPNHTAFDHPWIHSNPERYVLGQENELRERPGEFRQVSGSVIACGRDPYFAPWTDVAQLNYFNPDTRAAMIDVLHTIRAHADGVRCDMAMLVLNEVFEGTWRRLLKADWPALGPEFWPAAKEEAPSLVYLAEVYWDLEWTLQQQGFDFTYDKRLLDRLHMSSAREVGGHLLADPVFSSRLARFLENHDEPRSAAQFGQRLPAAATALATLPGMRFFFDGQVDGARLRAPVQLGRWPDEPASPQTRELYERLLAAADADTFHEGEWELLHVAGAGNGSEEHLLAWQWSREELRSVVVINLGDRTSDGHVQLAAIPKAERWSFVDELTGAEYLWDRQHLVTPGLYVRLSAGRSHVLTMRPTERGRA